MSTIDALVEEQAPAAATRLWSPLQSLLLALGAALVVVLITRPALGLDLLWNGLIPLAPALVVVAPGLWRNICPMATWSLLPRRLGISEARVPDRRTAARLRLAGLTALLLVVPARHLWFNVDGPLSALLLVGAAVAAFGLGLKYAQRGGWCAAACPIHAVERLYGISPAFTFGNARCDRCERCSAPCADSTRGMDPTRTSTPVERVMGDVLVGGFAGFVCGWFQVPDYARLATDREVLLTFLWPFGGGLASLALYLALRRFAVDNAARRRLVRAFAAAAVSAYYAFRVPALIGFGLHPGSGRLVDLSAVLPNWIPWLSAALTTAFFFWFLVIRPESGRSWTRRPATR